MNKRVVLSVICSVLLGCYSFSGAARNDDGQKEMSAQQKMVGVWQMMQMGVENGEPIATIGIKVFRADSTFTNYRVDNAHPQNLYPVMNGRYFVLTNDTYVEAVNGGASAVLKYGWSGNKLIIKWFNTGKYSNVNVGEWIVESYERIK